MLSEGNSLGPTPAVPPEKDETKSAITLSGLLNFTDGLWSCCGSERIFIFTTNHVERLDPALLRRGRMDMHIHMNNCSFPALKILVKNYLGFDIDEPGEGRDLEALRELEEAIEGAEMTPADISEVLIKHTRDRKTALWKLVEETRIRVDKRSKNNTLRKKKDFGSVFEDEEKEKREMPQSFKKGVEEEKRREAIKLPLKSE
ncbi:unnamed protein product [Cuscuta campestris]|uniref:Uncharacterized protein n=1 Tax=Cuscuta campestris TaxID=132261 RepID=A0A484NHD4_9ASTE|nr:unnamed protein product [Cuscuta campestris]